MRPHAPIATLALIFATGCKPPDEPPRQAVLDTSAPAAPDLGPSPAWQPPARASEATGAIAARSTASPPEIAPVGEPKATSEGASAAADVTEPEPDTAIAPPDTDTPDTPDIAPDIAPEIVAEVAPTSAPPDEQPVALPPLAPAVTESLSRAASAEQQESARALNKSGLEKHRKSDYAGAVADYQAALDAWPAHPFSRYNLACALALQGQPDAALEALAVLRALAETSATARDRLRAARVDNDFAALRKDARFRALTGFTEIAVAYAREDERPQAKRLAELLRAARLFAKAAPRPWNAVEDLPTTPTLLYRETDAIAKTLLDEATAAISPETAMTSAPAPPLPPEAPPIVVWLPSPNAAPSAPTPDLPDAGPTQPDVAAPPDSGDRADVAALTTVRDFIGRRLGASGLEDETLELKPTGFFIWEIVRGGAERATRTGRYQLRGDTLSLTYKETLESPVPGGPPRREVHEGQTMKVQLTVPEPGVLALDGKQLRAL